MATPTAQMRVLIPDNEQIFDGDYLFSDPELETYLEVANGNVLRASAYAINAIATSEAMISKVIKTQDLSTNGAAVADALRLTAKQLLDRADAEDKMADAFYMQIIDYNPHPAVPELTEWNWS